MKRIRKFASLLLAIVMVFSMTITALAAESGTITINNAIVGHDYAIYKILDLESYNADSNSYAYKASAKWSSFINSEEINGVYVNVTQGYVTWIENADAAAFAKAARKYAEKNEIASEASKRAAAEDPEATTTSVTFDKLELGYYLVDSSLGTLCSLDTTNPSVTISEKNKAPSNEKTVEEDSTGEYGKKDDADIGQTVNFKSTITAQAGAENYVFHDKMSTGLSYTDSDKENTSVKLNDETVDESNYTIVTEGLNDDCTFEVRFTQDFCDSLNADDEIVVCYSAILNENAVVGDSGNKNTSRLSYGDESNTKYTPTTETITYTWDVNIFKYTEKNEEEVALEGAEFILYKGAEGEREYAKLTDGKISDWTTEEAEATKLISDANGKIEIDGLDSDTYYLKETKAPDGYNLLAEPIQVKIDDKGEVNPDDKGVGLANHTVKVKNNSGSMLPSTGGIGTTVFYASGIILMAAAVFFVIRRKKA